MRGDGQWNHRLRQSVVASDVLEIDFAGAVALARFIPFF
jgi:hypothetical protein